MQSLIALNGGVNQTTVGNILQNLSLLVEWILIFFEKMIMLYRHIFILQQLAPLKFQFLSSYAATKLLNKTNIVT